jgi:hypothetical protein
VAASTVKPPARNEYALANVNMRSIMPMAKVVMPENAIFSLKVLNMTGSALFSS